MVQRHHPFSDRLIAAVRAVGDPASGPFVIIWPMPSNPAAMVSFQTCDQWLQFVASLSLRETIPLIVTAKYARAQKLMLLGWVDADLIKAAELVAFSTLELALTDRYGPQTIKAYGNRALAHMLRYMVEYDGLTDAKIAMNQRCMGGAVIDLLTGKRDPSLAGIRNEAAHGYPFDGFAWAGLLELVRDLIEYAYRDFAPEHA
jgi:hypothetical protein